MSKIEAAIKVAIFLLALSMLIPLAIITKIVGKPR